MKKNIIVLILAGLFLTGCIGILHSSRYLPSTKTITSSPWKSFEEAKSVYDRIIVEKTTINDLKNMGCDPYTNPNIKILNSTDIINRFLINPSIAKEDLDEGIQRAIKAQNRCFGYLFEPQVIDEKNTSNFLLHLFKFKREVEGTGWQFKGLVLIVDGIVVYKDPFGGQPKINVKRIQKNPLGPFQELGDWVINIGKEVIK